MTSKYAAFAMAAFVAATVSLSAFGEVSLTDQSALRHQQQQLKSNDKPNRGKARPQNPGKATGSQALIDQSGLKWFINTNITFSTSSSASAAASEASYTASVSATTSGGGVVNSTLNDAFDGYNALCISLNNTVATCQTGNANFVIYNKNGAATLDTNPDPNCLNRQVVFPVQTTGTLQLQRKMYVPPNDTFGRWMNIVTNTGAAAQTVTLVVANNLGSDSNTRIVTTSSGDATATTADEWVTTFQNYSGTTSSDPRLAHVLQQTGAPTPLAGINFADGDDNPFWGYTLTLQPGETQIILNFATGQPTKAAAATKAAELASLPAHAQQCMTAAELGQVVNFAPTTINLSVSTNTASEAAATAVTVTATANRAVLSNTTVDLAVTGTGITAGDYTLSNTQITIPAGQSTGTVTFTVVDDAIDEPDETATLTISNPSAGALLGTTTTQDIVITDNDTAGVTVTPTSGLTTTEAGGTATFTVVLTSQPTADVTIALASSDTTEGTVSAPSLTFTNVNWNVAQTVTVTGVDDFVDDGDIAYTINTGPITSTDPLYAAIDPADVAVTNTDDDTASVAIIPLVGTTITTTEAGGTATFTVVLTSQPAANVTIALASSDTSEGTVSPANLTFTPANFSTPQTVTVTGVDDAIADGAVVYTINVGPITSTDATYAAIDPPDVAVSNADNDTAGVTVTPTTGLTTTEAGGTATFTVALNSQPTANVSIALASSDTSEGTVSPANLTFTPANFSTAQTVTVTGVDDAIADGAIAYTVNTGPITSTDATYAAINPPDVAVSNSDNDTAGVTVTPTTGLTTTEAGGTATFTVALNSQPTANVSIALASSDTSEGTVSPASLTFTPANFSTAQTVTVTGVDDTTTDGDVAYTITVGPVTSTDATYAAINPPDVAVTNTDNDKAGAQLTATMTASGNFAPGGTVTFTVAITNSGTGDQANNPGPEFTDTLPPELILQSATLKASGSLNVDVPTNTVTWDGPLPAGATDRFDIVAQIRGNVGLGAVISNQGTLNFDSDGDGTNDATALTDDPATPTGNDATLITLAAAIPTLSFWAMLALALGVLAAVTYRQRRRLGA